MSKLREKVNKLLQGIQAGKKEDEKRLYDLTYNHLRIIARHYLKNESDIDDILQISYLRVFRYFNSVDASKDGYNWMCKIVQNESYRFLKKNKFELPLEEAYFIPGDFDITEALLAKDEFDECLKDYSPSDKKLIYLRFFWDYTYVEIAKMMGMKKSNVHKRISKIIGEILKKSKVDGKK